MPTMSDADGKCFIRSQKKVSKNLDCCQAQVQVGPAQVQVGSRSALCEL